MSKASKSRSRDRRMKEKKKRKEAQAAKYVGFRESGHNTKSKRARRRNELAAPLRTIRHRQGPCGNIGCCACQGFVKKTRSQMIDLAFKRSLLG